MKSLNQQIESVLGIGDVLDSLEDAEDNRLCLPTVVEYDAVPSTIGPESGMSQDQIDDYNLTRRVLHGAIKRGTVALEQVLTIGREAESLKAFETSAKIMKELTAMTEKLTALHTQGKPTTVHIGQQTNVQNNVQNNVAVSDEKSIANILNDLDDE